MLAVGFIGNRLGNLRIGFRERTGHPGILHKGNLKAFSTQQSALSLKPEGKQKLRVAGAIRMRGIRSAEAERCDGPFGVNPV
jgi:hypothetical protein